MKNKKAFLKWGYKKIRNKNTLPEIAMLCKSKKNCDWYVPNMFII